MKSEEMAFESIPEAADAIKEALSLLSSDDPVIVAATANVIMQTAMEIKLAATLRGLNDYATNAMQDEARLVR